MPRGRDHFQLPAYSAGRPGLVRPVRVDPRGETGPTPRQSRGPHWRSSSRGLFVPGSIDADDPAQRVLEASVLLPANGAVTGWGVLAWVGARWFDGFDAAGRRLPVTLVAPDHGIRPQPGFVVSEERLMPWERYLLDGVVVTDPARAVAYEMRQGPDVRAAVRWADMGAHADLVSINELRELAGRLAGWTGVAQMRSALDLADENAWSPAEVDMRMAWVLDLGLPRPLASSCGARRDSPGRSGPSANPRRTEESRTIPQARRSGTVSAPSR